MRVSKETMERHHRQIVEIASAMLRERGVQGVSLSDVMQAAGLTHGGFYRHFASKEALVAEATAAAFSEILEKLAKSSARNGQAAALAEYVTGYLSQRHVERPERGCPIPAFGADAPREGDAARAAFQSGVDGLLEWIAAGLAYPESERTPKAMALLSLMVGAITLARAAGSPALSKRILAEARVNAAALAGLELD